MSFENMDILIKRYKLNKIDFMRVLKKIGKIEIN